MAHAKTIKADITAHTHTATDIMVSEITARRIIADSQGLQDVHNWTSSDKEVLNDLWNDFVEHVDHENIDHAPGCSTRYAISAVIEFAVDGCCTISSR